jgi:hypothetical protein
MLYAIQLERELRPGTGCFAVLGTLAPVLSLAVPVRKALGFVALFAVRSDCVDELQGSAI